MGVLHEAAKKEDMSTLMKLTQENGAEWTKVNKDLHQNSILHIACEGGLKKLFEFAMSIQVDVNPCNVGGDTPLILAVKSGKLGFVEALLNAGADVNKSNIHGNTPLHYACYWRYEEIALILAKVDNAFIHINNTFQSTPIMRTSYKIKSLLEDIATEKGKLEIVGPTVGNIITTQAIASEIPKYGALALAKKIKDDWLIQASVVQILQPVSDGITSALFMGIWTTKNVAVKMLKLNDQLLVSEEHLGRIKSEINAIRKITHDNLLNVLAACLVAPNFCYLVDYALEGNLKERLFNPDIEISATESIKIALSVISGLLALHEAKPAMIHGNLKTSNILFFDDKIKLAHYGFQHSIFNQRVAFPYTYYDPSWLAPELLQGKNLADLDERNCDIYAFGLCFFEIITRTPIFSNLIPPLVLGLKISKGMTPAIPDYVPEALVKIMHRCWDSVPSKRPKCNLLRDELSVLTF